MSMRINLYRDVILAQDSLGNQRTNLLSSQNIDAKILVSIDDNKVFLL